MRTVRRLNKYQQLSFRKLRICCFILLAGNFLSLNAQHKGPIKWHTFKEAVELNKKNPKPFFIDVYTNWCGWCKHMDKTTFQDPQLAQYLNAKFYPIKFNAEQKDSVIYKGKTYKNNQYNKGKEMLSMIKNDLKLIEDSLGHKMRNEDRERIQKRKNKLVKRQSQVKRKVGRSTHSLARQLLNSKLSYPTCVFLFNNLSSNMPVPGYMKVNDALAYSTYIGEKVYMATRNAGEYKLAFDSAYFAKKPIKNVKWLNLNEALELQKKNPKKILISLTNPQSIPSIVLEKGIMESKNIANKLNASFYPVRLNSSDTSTYTINGKAFKNKTGIHELVYYFTQNKPNFPNQIFLDEKGQLIMQVPQFFVGSEISVVYDYFLKEAYKTQNFNDYKKSIKP